MSKPESLEFTPEEDRISPEKKDIIEALISDDELALKRVVKAGGEKTGGVFKSGRSIEEVRRLRDASTDRQTEEMLKRKKVKPKTVEGGK